MKISDLVTVIIWRHNPSPKRARILPKLLDYLRGEGFPVIVSDSSAKPYATGTDQNITFRNNPGEFFYDKIVNTISEVKTPYIVWHNDDDFGVPEAIRKCAKFAFENPKYSIVQGQLYMMNGSSYGNKEYKIWTHHYLESDDPSQRVFNAFRGFHTPVHAVLKKEVIYDATKIMRDHKHLHPIRYHDKVVSYVAGLLGDKKVLPVVFSIRSNLRYLLEPHYPKSLETSIPFNTIFKRLAKQGDPISQYFADKTGIKLEEAKEITVKAFKICDKCNSIKAKLSKEMRGVKIALPSSDPKYQKEILKIKKLGVI